MDIRPKKASPILNKNTKLKIPTAIENPFFLKKLIIGPPIVPVIQAVKLVIIFFDRVYFLLIHQFLFVLIVFQLKLAHEQTLNLYSLKL